MSRGQGNNGGGGAPTSELFPDLHHKMSKKIAQLTKVIYHLNTRNEDHKSAMELLQYQHQLELQQVARDAATKIARFKTLVESRKAAGQMEGQMHEMRRQYDAERQHADRLFTDLKGRMAAKERRLHLEFQVKVDTQQMEIAQMSARFQERLAALEGVNDELRRALEAAGTSSSQGIEEWRRRYDEDLKEVQETHRARLQAEKDALRKDHVDSMHRALQVRRCVCLLVCSLDTCALTATFHAPSPCLSRVQELSASLRAEGEKAVAMVRAQLSGETADAVAIVEKDHAAKMEALAAAHKTEMEKMQLELLWQRTEVDSLAGTVQASIAPCKLSFLLIFHPRTNIPAHDVMLILPVSSPFLLVIVLGGQRTRRGWSRS